MKTIKNLITLFLALPMLAAFTSCSEQEADYHGAFAETGGLAFFSNEQDDAILLEENQTSFTYEITRLNTKGELTVPLLATQAANVLTAPSTATFKDGDSIATINVGVDFNYFKENPDKDYLLELALQADTTLYGSTKVTVAVKYAPWTDWCNSLEEWKEVGGTKEEWPLGEEDSITCTYKLGAYFSGDMEGLKVVFRRSLVDDTKVQFAFKDFLEVEGFYLAFDATYNEETGLYDLVLPMTKTPYSNSNYGTVMVSDWPENLKYFGYSIEKNPQFGYDYYPCSYDPEKGLFTLNLFYTCEGLTQPLQGWDGVETAQVDGFVFPDYNVNVSYVGGYVDKNEQAGALLNITKGVDLDYYKYVLMPGEYYSENNIALITSNLNKDQMEGAGMCSDADTNLLFPLDEDGDYFITYVGYNVDGDSVTSGAYKFTYERVGAKEWESIGFCEYTEDFVTTIYKVDNVTYEVEVEKNINKPGLYRMINPYGEAYPYNGDGDYDAEGKYPFVIDATDPDKVFIPCYQNTGMAWDYGEFWMTSVAGYYLANGVTPPDSYFGKLQNNVITFPQNMLLMTAEDIAASYSWQTANMNGAFALNLNPVSSNSKKYAGSKRYGAKKRVMQTIAGQPMFQYILPNKSVTSKKISKNDAQNFKLSHPKTVVVK